MSPLDRNFERYDMDDDGKLSTEEIEKSKEMLELELREEKADTHRRMAWTCLVAVILLTVVLLSGYIPIEQLNALAPIIPMIYISLGSIVGAYVGFQTWMSRG